MKRVEEYHQIVANVNSNFLVGKLFNLGFYNYSNLTAAHAAQRKLLTAWKKV